MSVRIYDTADDALSHRHIQVPAALGGPVLVVVRDVQGSTEGGRPHERFGVRNRVLSFGTKLPGGPAGSVCGCGYQYEMLRRQAGCCNRRE